MYWIVVIVGGVFLVLLHVAKDETVPDEKGMLMKPFCKIARYLYGVLVRRFPHLFATPGLESSLCRLHPGEDGGNLVAMHWVNKMSLCLLVIVVGTLFGVVANVSAGTGRVLDGEGVVTRGDWQEETKEVVLYADYKGERLDFLLEVNPRRLTATETDRMFDELERMLPQLILGGNEDLQNIRSDLQMLDAYDGFPVAVEWKSNHPNVINSAGRVKKVQEPTQVLLSVKLCYGEYCRESNIVVAVKPPLLTAKERLYRELKTALEQSGEVSAEQMEWQLPRTWNETDVSWGQKIEENGVLIWLGAVAVAVLLYFCSDRDLQETLEKRKVQMRREYPEIVHKLVLFVGAGMTLRGAFGKLARDYEERIEKGKLPAYEEIVFSCNELAAGISEGTVYERLGKRIGLQEYIRLGALMAQNLKRGNSTLLERLREEADLAAEEQLQHARKVGEEAGTKLLVPMVLQLAVVMVVIMVPVFLTM